MLNQTNTIEKLVEIITREVLIAVEEDKLGAPAHQEEYCKVDCADGICVRTCFDKVGNVITAGADRLSSKLGIIPANLSIASMIDHTLLKPDATKDQIAQLCFEARKYGFASVCVNPANVALCAELLRGTNVKVASVIGFPFGATTTKVKVLETEIATTQGAHEVDMVINIGALKSGDTELVARDISEVTRAAHRNGALVKVIIETALLTNEEKVTASLLSKEAGADFVKTSTGYAGGGATVEDVALMRRVVGPEMGVKASGGVRTAEDADNMVKAGATRIGASASVKIVQGEGSAKSSDSAAKGY